MCKYAGSVVALAMLVWMMSACSQQLQPTTSDQVAAVVQSANAITQVATTVQSATTGNQTVTPTVYDVKAALELTNIAVRQTRVAMFMSTQTVMALTPTQFWPTQEPTWTQAPAPTNIVGVIRQTCTIDSFVMCGGWRGLLNGELYNVYVGAYRARGRKNYNVGVVAVKRADERVNESPDGFYEIPDNFGVATVLDINDTRLTLAQVNPKPMTDALGAVNLLPNGRRIIFDLATRQFLTPDGTPYPAGTLTPPPAGTLTPAPIATIVP